MRFRLIEENELERRAKYHRKRQNGMSPFYSPDGGNVPLAISRFNNSVADGANGLAEDFTFNPLKDIVLKTLDFLWDEGFAFPGDDLLADNWNNLKDGVEMGIDPLNEVAEFLVDYLQGQFSVVDKDLAEEAKQHYKYIVKYLNKNESLKEDYSTYKGYDIEYNFYGDGEYSVQYCGDDVIFETEEEARNFIDEISFDSSESDLDESIGHTRAVEMALRGIYGRRISDALDDYLSRFPYAEVFDSRRERNKFIDWAKKNRYIESLEEDVIPNKEINYIGFFVNNKDINRVLKSIGARSLEKRIPVPHVTTEYKPKEIETSLFGKTIDIVINGYGKNDTNEGFRVELRTNDPDLQNQIDNIAAEGSIPHITTSISADGKAVNTRYLDFKDIKPITIKGTFGGFTKNKGIITRLNESLLTEYGGGYRVSRYIKNFSNGVSNGINGLFGLEDTDPHKKRNKRRYGYKQSVRTVKGNNKNKSKVAPENANRRYYGDLKRRNVEVVKFNEGDFDDMCRENNVLLRDKKLYKEIRKTACDRNGINLQDLVTKMQESNPKITKDYALYIIDEYIEDAR